MDHYLITSADAVGLFCRMYMNLKRDLPIRPSEMGVLIFTQKQNIPVTPLMLSNFFRIAKPSVTSIINSLIRKEYLIKIPSTTDGRSYTVSTTDKGKKLVKNTFDEYFKIMQVLKSKMGRKDFALFVDLIQKANNILSEEKRS
ncbi:winged helix-turn-helix transcriptional regulator [Mobilitalea sibirica]|uniref:Winged helix-turn-helix transcriptional regulator n=1 Tax=Mobilitalea sibirica TaxID=1462919 RepID=A0A8J7H100_9FIRM|nr:MarR family winged helix-turn-helix transcriptional regulator [Mobilitalea sibirica]MBH1939944.1 winged helix-turn-helix transcriptional regulator [Mobilitalea sibirica]